MGSSEFIGAVEEHVEQLVERCSYGEGRCWRMDWI